MLYAIAMRQITADQIVMKILLEMYLSTGKNSLNLEIVRWGIFPQFGSSLWKKLIRFCEKFITYVSLNKEV